MTKYYTISFESFWKIVDTKVYYFYKGKFILARGIDDYDVKEAAREISYKAFLLHSN